MIVVVGAIIAVTLAIGGLQGDGAEGAMPMRFPGGAGGANCAAHGVRPSLAGVVIPGGTLQLGEDCETAGSFDGEGFNRAAMTDDDLPREGKLLPLHAVSTGKDDTLLHVRRRPGRPRRVRPAPDADELEYLDAVNSARDEAIEQDDLVEVSRRRHQDPMGALRAIKIALAEESASLKWEIAKGSRSGRDVGQMTSRRIDGLVKIALIELGIRKLGIDALDPSDPRLQRTFEFFMASVEAVLEEVLPVRSEDLVARCRGALEGWEQKALG